MAASTKKKGVVDPTKAGKYPVILSDALLGKSSKESFTGIQYNHKPSLSSDTAPATARLKPSARDDSFNLGFDDKGNKYTFNGSRTTNDGQYVLIFDPAREAFVLHRLDSLFHMNVTRTPTNSDPKSLRKEFPHLQISSASTSQTSRDSSNKGSPSKPPPPAVKGKIRPATSGVTSVLRKPKDTAARKPAKEKTVSLTLPEPPKPAPAVAAPPAPAPAPAPTPASAPTSAPAAAPPKRRDRPPEPESEEEDDDDDDGGLTVEYPGGEPPSTDFSPRFPAQISRRFSDFVRGGDEDDDEDGDADAEFETGASSRSGERVEGHRGNEEEGEDDDDDEEEEIDFEDAFGPASGDAGVNPTNGGFERPNPVDHRPQQPQQPQNGAGVQPYDAQPTYANDADADADADLEADLEAELEREFQQAGGQMDMDSESSVSEED